MAAAAGGRVWFKYDQAVACAVMSADAIVYELSEEIQKKFAGQLQAKVGRVLDASELVLKTADGKVYDDPAAPVPTVHTSPAQALIVTGVSPLARSAACPL